MPSNIRKKNQQKENKRETTRVWDILETKRRKCFVEDGMINYQCYRGMNKIKTEN